MKEYPLGPCKIEYTLEGEESPVVLGLTLKEEEVLFSAGFEIYSVEVDQMQGPYIANVIPGEVTLTCTIPLDLSVLPKLSNTYIEGTTGVGFTTVGKPLKFGKLKVHPLSAGDSTDFDITGPRVSCLVNTQINFKTEDTPKVALTFNFSTDIAEESPTKGLVYTWGNYAAKA